jgi:uncharacterized membrane protein YeaQ/YmgE (transglycosylase-associated protein family)
MGELEFSPEAQLWVNTVLIWIGFGTLVGLAAKLIMPGRDPGGAVATLAMGITGTVIGLSLLSYFWHEELVTPISPMGFLVATAGSFILLSFYRILAGSAGSRERPRTEKDKAKT